MKKRLITAIICLSLILVMSFGGVSAWEGGEAISFVKPLDGDAFPASKSIEVEVEVNQPSPLDTINITIWNDAGYSETILDNNPTISEGVATVTHTFSNLLETDHYLIAKANDSSTPNTWISTAQIKVEYNEAPVIVFSMNTSIEVVPFVILFDASSTADPEENTPLTYEWDFGDGDADTGEEVVHKYTTAGVYTVELTVTDSLEMSDSLTKTVTARPSCGALGADETCVAVPEDLSCDIINKPSEAGLNCDEDSAERYCGDTLNYGGYVAGSKNCDTINQHGITNYGQSNFCGASRTDYKWILSLKCTGTVSAAGACTDTEGIGIKNYYDKGTRTSPEGTVEDDACRNSDAVDGIDVDEGAWLLEIYCISDTEIGSEFYKCPNGCVDGACVAPAGGLYCPENNGTESPVAGLLRVPPKSRQIVGGTIYYCGLDLFWNVALDLDASCTDDYECISNTCVDSVCISITEELQAQRNFLMRIWCFLTNMQSFFGDKLDYCECYCDGNGDGTINTGTDEETCYTVCTTIT